MVALQKTLSTVVVVIYSFSPRHTHNSAVYQDVTRTNRCCVPWTAVTGQFLVILPGPSHRTAVVGPSTRLTPPVSWTTTAVWFWIYLRTCLPYHWRNSYVVIVVVEYSSGNLSKDASLLWRTTVGIIIAVTFGQSVLLPKSIQTQEKLPLTFLTYNWVAFGVKVQVN